MSSAGKTDGVIRGRNRDRHNGQGTGLSNDIMGSVEREYNRTLARLRRAAEEERRALFKAMPKDFAEGVKGVTDKGHVIRSFEGVS